MTANAGYHLFNTGDVLTAAQVQYNLQNQTIMYFASSAARTSALSGVLVEGMFSYLADTNSTEYYDGAAWQSISNPGDITAVTAGTGISGGGTSGAVTVTNSMATEITAAGDIIVGTGSGTFDNLPIGTTAQVLTADTTVSPYKVKWATPAASSNDFVKISAANWTAAAAQSLTSVFSATYDDYCIVFDNMVGTAAANAFSIRMRSGGTNDTNSTYYYASMGLEVGGTATNINGSGVTEFKTAGLVESPHVAGLVIWIFNPFEAVRTSLVWQIFGNTSTNFVYRTGGGLCAAKTVFDGVGFFLAGGGNSSKDKTVYGLKKRAIK